MTTDILFTKEGHIGFIYLNRQSSLNAITLSMIQALALQLHTWEADDNIHAVVIEAGGGRAFCAGGDIRWIYDMHENRAAQLEFFRQEYQLNYYLSRFKKPYIALMDGITMGGGVGISLYGSHPVASSRFVFAMPETGIGFFPDIGASYLLSHCKGEFGFYFGLYLGLTGTQINAKEAADLGLIKQVIDCERMGQLREKLLDCDLSKEAYNTIDRCISDFAVQETLLECSNRLITNQEIIHYCFNQNSVEDIFAALQINSSKNAWARTTLDNLERKSPLSLKITYEQIQQAKSKTIAECLVMDYCMVNHFLSGNDFYEGVRSLLIDKDQSPRWQPQSLSEISTKQVLEYFN